MHHHIQTMLLWEVLHISWKWGGAHAFLLYFTDSDVSISFIRSTAFDGPSRIILFVCWTILWIPWISSKIFFHYSVYRIRNSFQMIALRITWEKSCCGILVLSFYIIQPFHQHAIEVLRLNDYIDMGSIKWIRWNSRVKTTFSPPDLNLKFYNLLGCVAGKSEIFLRYTWQVLYR